MKLLASTPAGIGLDIDVLLTGHIRESVVHVDYVRTEPPLNNVIPHIKLL